MSHKPIITSIAKTLIAVALVFTLLTPTYSKTSNLQQEVDGYYYLEEKASKAFPEIEYIHLSTLNAKGKPVPLHGFIRLGKRKTIDYKFESVSLENKTLTFKTQPLSGIHYEFSGKLLTASVMDSSSDDIVLKGTLKKLQNQKIIKELSVALTYFTGD